MNVAAIVVIIVAADLAIVVAGDVGIIVAAVVAIIVAAVATIVTAVVGGILFTIASQSLCHRYITGIVVSTLFNLEVFWIQTRRFFCVFFI